MATTKRWKRMLYKGLREFMWAMLAPSTGLLLGLAMLSTEPSKGSYLDSAGHVLLFVGIVGFIYPLFVVARWLMDHDWDDLQEPNPLTGLPDISEPPSQ